MRIGFVADAHGNPDGLRACLRVLRERNHIERVYFLGDAVGYLPGFSEVIEILRSKEIVCLRGNHEAMLLGELDLDPAKDQVYRLSAVRDLAEDAELDFLAACPSSLEIEIDGKRLLLVHGSPWNPLTEYVYPDSDLSRFDDLAVDAVVMANTHRPFVAQVGSTLVANAGSCGLPRDHGSLAACAIYDSTDGSARILRVPFDSDLVRQKYEGQIHPSVAAIFDRHSEPDLVGEIIE